MQPPPSLQVLETCLYAPDLDHAERFYTSVLGLKVLGRAEGRHVFFRCGSGMLLVFNPERTRERETDFPPHGTSGPGHLALGVPNQDFPAWLDQLGRCGVLIEKDYLWPSGGRSIYFRDPAGNSVELASPTIWGIEEAAFFASATPGAADRPDLPNGATR